MGKRNHFNTERETPENQQRLAQGGKKRFNIQDLTRLVPLTVNQQLFKDAYCNKIDVIFQLGAAGCGKTSMALSEAFYEILSPGSIYRKVIIIRSAVEARKIGHLPGELEEKQAPFEDPYRELVKDIFKYADPYDNLKAVGLIEFRLTSHLRGINLDNAIVILDEAQNLDYEELDTVYTRITTTSKIIVCGDGKQTDLHRYREQSGLAKFVSIFDNMYKYENEFVDLSNMLTPNYEEGEINNYRNNPNYKVINYEPKDCLRNPKVRKYLITKHNMGL